VTVELLGYDAPSGIELLIAWLLPLSDMDDREIGAERPSGGPLPYSMVQCVAGSDDKVTDTGIYQVDDFAATFSEAEANSRLTRRRILALGPPLCPQRRVTISTGTYYADSVLTSVKPHWEDYGDNTVFRFVSRYAIDLRMVAV
jgi:hypothetical protein